MAAEARAKTCSPLDYCTWGKSPDSVHDRGAKLGSASAGNLTANQVHFVTCLKSTRYPSRQRILILRGDDNRSLRCLSTTGTSSAAGLAVDLVRETSELYCLEFVACWHCLLHCSLDFENPSGSSLSEKTDCYHGLSRITSDHSLDRKVNHFISIINY